ncbi:50S ribosomal protein L4 [Candidatus Gottesmanbacteria bacterium RBG_16_37_8]|uniref:Large ribosomal subunit protein uL4 n=1 Tax=Candidatus Gottesmanbacteria bacterium RBG_16_37_8 TaxID=1798371 RepID=A0A1F5YTB4_9BACT|nr:MAG: 50S ribosomal protein L4 [Candidatus Gottesmanbacteria bacterium RBG_16_37_8]
MPKKQTVKIKDLKVDVYNVKGEKTGKITLPENVFAAKVNPVLLAQSVRVFQVNQRLGTRKTKTRGEVNHSGRKIYRQKGTGRARHGSIKAPIFIGGGVAHGPKLKDYQLNLSKKMRRLALYGALTHKYQTDSIKFINHLNEFPAKTKKMVEFLENFKLLKDKKKKSSLLLVTDKIRHEVILSGRNLPYLSITPVNQLNTYEVLRNNCLLMEKNTVDILQGKASSPAPLVEKSKTVNKELPKKSKTVKENKSKRKTKK